MKVKASIVLIGGSSCLEMTEKLARTSGRDDPRFLVVPTASGDDEAIIEENEGYLKQLGYGYDFLLLTKNEYSKEQLEDFVEKADIIYVPGGDSLRMDKIWMEKGLEELVFSKAGEDGAVLAGSSAGGMKFAALSLYEDPENKEILIFTGMALADVIFCPHYQLERYKGFDSCLERTAVEKIAFAAGDDTGIHFTPDGRIRAIYTSAENSVWSFTFNKGKWKREEFPPVYDSNGKIIDRKLL